MDSHHSKPSFALEMKAISKSFPGVQALSGVSFSVRVGQIHALCGENGAGKSTLMKILSGFYSYEKYEGEIRIHSEVKKFGKMSDSKASGISIVHQELSLFPELSVSENIFVGREPSRYGILNQHSTYAQTQKLLSTLGLKISPTTKIKDLGVGQQQLIEIAKALSQNPKILVLDEPTSALNQAEVQILLKILKRLKTQGVSSVLISHKLDEVLEVADWITILRDGKTVASYPREEATEQRIIAEMVGRELTAYYPSSHRTPGEKIFELKDYFHIRKKEVLGIFGLMGAGRTELLMDLFGASPRSKKVTIWLNGKTQSIRSPRDAISKGIAFLPEDRKRFGLILEQSILKNMSLSAVSQVTRFGRIQEEQEIHRGIDYQKRLRIKASSLQIPVRTLSGGNQQKVVMAKCLLTLPKLLFLDEPTRGIDVGAKAEIYQYIHDLAEQGMAVVMVSSELPEILGMSDRILVMRAGKCVAEFNAADATQEKIMAAATGTTAEQGVGSWNQQLLRHSR